MGDSTGGFVWATMIGRLRRRAREFLFPVTSGLKPTRLDDSLHGDRAASAARRLREGRRNGVTCLAAANAW